MMAGNKIKTYIYLIGEPEPQLVADFFQQVRSFRSFFFYHRRTINPKKMLSNCDTAGV